jgi:putative superfamily III holin-X
MNTSNPPTSTIVNLLRELRDDTTSLLQQEVTLAKAEMSEKASEMAGNAVQLSIGGFVAYAGGIIVLLGIADLVAALLIRAGVAPAVSTWVARTIIGLIVAITGWLMVNKAKNALSNQNLVPEKTIDSLQKNKDWAEDKIQQTNEARS